MANPALDALRHHVTGAIERGEKSAIVENPGNGYKAFYNGRTADIYAETSRAAQLKAAEIFRVSPKKVYQISVVLCEKDGESVSHSGAEF